MIKQLFKVLLGLAIVIVVGGLSQYLLTHKSKTQRVTIEKPVPKVNLLTLSPASVAISVSGLARVVPAREVNLVSEVNGTVTGYSDTVEPGGYVTRGDTLFELDRRDLITVVNQRKNELAQKELAVTLEKARAETAVHELVLLGEELTGLSRDLVLRVPQEKAALSDLQAAHSNLKKAQTDLARTAIKAPFNAVVTKRYSELGSAVSRSATLLANLVGTDRVWIKFELTLSELHSLGLDKGDPQITLTHDGWQEGITRSATIKQVIPEVDSTSQMASLLLEVSDPFSLNEDNKGVPVLLIGSLMGVKITGQQLDNVYKLSQSNLHDGDVFLLKDNKLFIKEIEVVYDDKDHVYFYDLAPSLSVVGSHLPYPVSGMSLEISSGE